VQAQGSAVGQTAARTRGRDRASVARVVAAAEAGRRRGVSVGQTAAAEGVPESTLYRWLGDKEWIDAPEAVRDFFGSPEGLATLQDIVVAAQLAFVQAGGCGVDRMSEFLALSRLDRFAAASHGEQHGLATRIVTLLGEYGDEQRERLGATMAPRRIVVCEDETFHPATCLVAIDAESGLILVECYRERRDGATWTAALSEALAGLPVEVVRVVGDEAKGLIHHARRGLGVEHGADLFHVQHDLSAATALSLARRLERPRERLEEAEAVTNAWRAHKTNYARGPRPPGRPMDYDRRIADALAVEADRRADLAAAEADQAAVRDAVRSLSDAYHVVDLKTGALQSVDALRSRLEEAMAIIDAVSDRARLASRCRERIDKARRVLPKLVAGLAFFHGELDRALAALDLTPAVLDVVRTELLPGRYLARTAKRARSAAEGASLRDRSHALLAKARAPAGAFMALDPQTRDHIERVVQATLALFVRSTACVEGRNGHLARYHHGLHRLSNQRLKSLTVLANFYARRADGSTAAERFYGRPPDDLFDWLIDHLPPPARPRAQRFEAAA